MEEKVGIFVRVHTEEGGRREEGIERRRGTSSTGWIVD